MKANTPPLKKIALALACMLAAPFTFAQATTYYATPTIGFDGATIHYWNDEMWALSSTADKAIDTLKYGPAQGDNVNITLGTGNCYLRIIENSEDGYTLGGLGITSGNYTRTIGTFTVSGAKKQAFHIFAGVAGHNSTADLTLKIGTMLGGQVIWTFANSNVATGDSTKMNIEIDNLSISGKTPGGVNFGTTGTSGIALNSVKIGNMTIGTDGSNAKDINFYNVTENVEFTGTITKSGAGADNFIFTNVGGDIIFAAKENGLNFKALDMSTLMTNDNDIIFTGLSSFLFESQTQLISWTSIAGTATASDIIDAMNNATNNQFGTFKLNLAQDGIIFTAVPIPEASEFAVVFGLLSLAFAAYRRRRALK